MRPSSAARASGGAAAPPIQGRLRPQSAALLQHQQPPPETPSGPRPGPSAPKGLAAASSEELIRDLEDKVRKVVEVKRAESDRLRFAVSRKREEVEKARLVLHDLVKDSEALGLHYHASTMDNYSTDSPDGDEGLEEEPDRLQPISAISRRPVYSKHTKISELETRLARRTDEAHDVQRGALVLEHIKKRLLAERVEVKQTTNELKVQFAELGHQTQELMKRDIAASDAVSQVQAQLAQQKADMATNLRNYRRELDMRQKWAREKAKFDKYYNDQIQAVQREASSLQNPVPVVATKPGSPTNRRRSFQSPSGHQKNLFSAEELETQNEHREAFMSIGFGHDNQEIDPADVVRTHLSHVSMIKELDAQRHKDLERISQLQKQIAHTKSMGCDNIPLSKRGTSQRIETKEVEISSVERALATVVDQYMYVDQAVRPIKMGLQQILQNVRNETVNVDNVDELERMLVDSCDEMMRLVRENSQATRLPQAEPQDSNLGDGIKAFLDLDDVEGNNGPKSTEPRDLVSAESFTSPFNIRVPPKPSAPYFVLGISTDAPPKPENDETEETDFDVMDRSTVKRISSVLVCTSTGKKAKDDNSGRCRVMK